MKIGNVCSWLACGVLTATQSMLHVCHYHKAQCTCRAQMLAPLGTPALQGCTAAERCRCSWIVTPRPGPADMQHYTDDKWLAKPEDITASKHVRHGIQVG